MNVSRRHPARLAIALAAAAVVLVIGAMTAFGQGAPTDPATSGGGASATTGSTGVAVSGTTVAARPDGVVSSGIAAPWCCGSSSYVPGLTTVGQATADGQDSAARDAAIAEAVKDATAQANAAADAAGIQLGAIIDLQVSAMPYYYPMMGTASGTSPGSSGSSGGGMEPAPAPNVYQSPVSVTITWALG